MTNASGDTLDAGNKGRVELAAEGLRHDVAKMVGGDDHDSTDAIRHPARASIREKISSS